MLKITLPNGAIIEGDVQDLVPLVNQMVSPQEKVSDDVPELITQPAPPEVEKIEVPEKCPNILSFNDLITKEPEKIIKRVTFPHNYSDDYRAVKIGAREDQAMQAAKLIAEQAGNRSHEFKTREVMEVINDNSTIWITGSALQHLLGKGLVRHGKHSRCWYVTERGWVSRYKVTQPLRNTDGPTV